MSGKSPVEIEAGGERKEITPSAATPCSADDVDKLKARITQLESYLDKTADGKLVCECEKLYCPKCGVSLPRTIPKKRWWKCTCHGRLQRYFYPTIIGKQKLCYEGWAKYLWNVGTEKAGQR